MDGSEWCAGTTIKWTAAALQLLSVALQRTVVKENFPVSRSLTVAPDCTLCLGGRDGQLCDYMPIY